MSLRKLNAVSPKPKTHNLADVPKLKVNESDPTLRVYVGRQDHRNSIGIKGDRVSRDGVVKITVDKQTKSVRVRAGDSLAEVASKVARLHFDGFDSSWANTGRKNAPHYIAFFTPR